MIDYSDQRKLFSLSSLPSADVMSRSFFVDSLIVQKPTVTSHTTSHVPAVTSSAAGPLRHQSVLYHHPGTLSSCTYPRHPAELLGLCCPLCVHPHPPSPPAPLQLPAPPSSHRTPPPPHHPHPHPHPHRPSQPDSPVSASSLTSSVSSATTRKAPSAAHSAIFGKSASAAAAEALAAVAAASLPPFTHHPSLQHLTSQLMSSQFAAATAHHHHPHLSSSGRSRVLKSISIIWSNPDVVI
jgi:hypothetical protein